MAKACIITIGNEILKGRTVNTNAAHIGRFLTSRGYEVSRALTVRDDLGDINWAIDSTVGLYDLIVTTGGLGPTFDDMTVEGIARALDIKLVEDPGTLKLLKARYEKLNLELTEERLKLALIPDGSIAIRNRVGAAPGIWIERTDSHILILPGVPREMEAILEDAAHLFDETSRHYYESTQRLEGIMESSIAPFVTQIMKKHEGKVYIKSHPLKSEERGPEIDVEVSAYADSEVMAEKLVMETMDEILQEAERIRNSRVGH